MQMLLRRTISILILWDKHVTCERENKHHGMESKLYVAEKQRSIDVYLQLLLIKGRIVLVLATGR